MHGLKKCKQCTKVYNERWVLLTSRSPSPSPPPPSLHPKASAQTSFSCIFQKWSVDLQAPAGDSVSMHFDKRIALCHLLKEFILFRISKQTLRKHEKLRIGCGLSQTPPPSLKKSWFRVSSDSHPRSEKPQSGKRSYRWKGDQQDPARPTQSPTPF